MSQFFQITNLPPEANADQLWQTFEAIGPVEDAVSDPATPGIGLIRLPDDAPDVSAAAIGDTPLTVIPATEEQIARLMRPSRLLSLDIAQQLGESSGKALTQIEQIIDQKGEEFARAMLAETFQIEAQGGMMTMNGKRRRTIGGVFFYLTFEKLEKKLRKKIYGGTTHTQAIAATRKDTAEPGAMPELQYDKRLPLLQELLEQKGEATSVKLTLIGRPGRIEFRRDLVMTVMSHVIPKSLPLPKGLPTPPSAPTNYAVYIGIKQWRRVEEAIKDPADALIVEGTGFFDPEFKGVSVLATNVTTKNLQRAKRESDQALQPQNTEESSSPAVKVTSAAPVTASTPAQYAAAPSTSEETFTLPTFSSDQYAPTDRPRNSSHRSASKPATSQREAPKDRPVAPPAPARPSAKTLQRLAELQDLEQEARSELDEIKSLPPDEQTGLTAALQKLQKIKAEIKALQQGG